MQTFLKIAALLSFAAVCNVAQAADGHAAMSVGATVVAATCVASSDASTSLSAACRPAQRIEHAAAIDHVAGAARFTISANADIVEVQY